MKLRRPRTATSLGLATAALLITAGLSSTAEARPNLRRKGGQFGVMLGGSACIPGKAECTRQSVSVDGRTRPSLGLGAELGYRFNRYVFVGAAYNLGFFDTDYAIADAMGYRRGYQNSVFGVVRPTLPVWRFDFGLGVGAGFSRQAFVVENSDDKDYSQGFAFKLAPTIDIFVSRRIFVGAKMDLIINGHGKTCHVRDNSTSTICTTAGDTDLAPVHQMLFGLHVGGTFL
jgi:hypothetical protein